MKKLPRDINLKLLLMHNIIRENKEVGMLSLCSVVPQKHGPLYILVLSSVYVPSQTRVPTQAQAGQTAQVTLTKPPVVSVPAVVSSAGVTTLPVTVAGISVAIAGTQKTGVFKVWILDFFSDYDCCSSCPCGQFMN